MSAHNMRMILQNTCQVDRMKSHHVKWI